LDHEKDSDFTYPKMGVWLAEKAGMFVSKPFKKPKEWGVNCLWFKRENQKQTNS